jgi:hypothetical protein
MPDKIGFLVATKQGDWSRYIQWFEDKLKHKNMPIEKKPGGGAGGDTQKIIDAAVEPANDPDVKVIVTAGTGAALALKAATQMNRKPFVFASVGDPTLSNLVPVPGSTDNFTGGNNRQAQERVVKLRVDYMLSNPAFQGPFAILGNHNIDPSKTAMDIAHDYLTRFHGKTARLFSVTPADDIATKIGEIKNDAAQYQALYVCSDLFLTVNSTDLNRLAQRRPNPMVTMFEFEEHKQAHGADDFYGSDFKEMFEKAAVYVDEILDNAHPSDLPIYIASLSGQRPWPIIAKKPKGKGPRKKK